jgi:NitT/TauT family transport system substrate-binding protein
MFRALTKARLVAAAALGTVAILASGCASTSSENTSSSKGEAAGPVRVAVDSFTLGTQFFVGKEKGYFDEPAVDVQTQVYSTGVAALDAVLGGQADVAPALDFATMSRVGTGRLQVLGSLANPEAGFHKLAVRDSLSVPAGLKGKRIGYVPGTAEEFVTRNYLELNNIGTDEVELLKFDGLFELVSAMKAGRVDAGWLWGQGMDQIKDDKSISVVEDDRAAQAGGPTIFLVSTKDYAAANTDTLAKLITGLDKASDFVQSNVEEAAEIDAKGVKGDAAVIAGVIPSQHFQVGMGKHDVERMQVLQKFAQETGAFEVPGDVKDLLSLDAIRQAVADKVTVD